MNFQRTILSGLLTHGKDAWAEHGGTLNESMFDGDLKIVFRAVASMHAAERFVDAITIAEKLGPEHDEMLRQISSSFSSAATLGGHIKELQIQHSENHAKDIGAKLMESGDFELARLELDRIGDTSAQGGTVDSMTVLAGFMDELDRGDDFTGLSTGLKRLDDLLGGLVPADLILIAGRPSMGKTAEMLNIVKHTITHACPVGIFSLEMPKEKLMRRMVASYGIDLGGLQRPKTLTDSDWANITKATQHIHGAHQIYTNDIGGLSIGALESEARRMVKKHGCGLICIDYLQLVTCKAEKRLEVVSEVSRRLKAMAKNLKVPVIALSQLNRQMEGTLNPVPSLSMLRESGQLEQDADVVVFVDRPEQRNKNDRPGEADLIVAKNRDGETGTATVAWQGKYQRFTNLEHNWYPGGEA